jgi:trans-2-enoyl-CoA reductase
MAVAALAVSDILAVAALAVSVISLGVSYTTLRRTKKSEEIRISREIWDRIDAHEGIIEKWTLGDHSDEDNRKAIGAIDSLINEMDYFVYLTENREIEDPVVRDYYRKRLIPIFRTAKFIDKQDPQSTNHSGTQKILGLIEKYHKVIGKTRDYEKEFR